MIEYNSKNIIVGEIKQLLKSVNLPPYKVLLKGTRYFKDRYYIYNNQIMYAISDGVYDDNLDNFIFINNFNLNKYLLNVSSNLIINNNYYDWRTHEQLGNWLRFQRDYYNLDLMGMYNCYNGQYANRLYIEDSNDNIFDSTNNQYKLYVVSAKFNQKYTIALDCNSDIEIVAGLYSNENQKDKLIDYLTKVDKIKDLYNLSYTKINPTRFNSPIIYDKLVDTSSLGVEFYDNESILKLFIKVPATNKSSLVVLEGDYTKVNKGYETNKVMSSYNTIINFKNVDNLTNDVFTSIHQLLLLNSKIDHPFSDRLIEYICNNVITPQDSMNIKKLEDSMIRDGLLDTYTTGLVFNNEMRAKLYNKAINKGVLNNSYDVIGYVDRDIEDRVIVDYVYPSDKQMEG